MILSFLRQAIRFSTIFIFGSTGETLVEKGGHLNLGIPGIMCFGAVGGCTGELMYMNSLSNPAEMNGFLAVFIPIIMAFIFASLLGLVYSFFTITLRCNQNVTGLTITTFGSGVLSFWGEQMGQAGVSFHAPSTYFLKTFSFAQDMGDFGKLFFSHGTLVYLAIFTALIVALVLKKTRIGMHLRAVGENPAAADAAGINVTKYKYLSSTIGAGISGLGGLFYIMDYLSGSLEYTIEAMGWLAVALVIFSVWKPNWGILGAIVFAVFYLIPNTTFVNFMPKELVKMIPYVVTIIVLIILSIIGKKENQPPASLGLPYFREER